ncbi:protocadherin delta 1 [Paragonimus westermani]|uniref:Protocadherin delta 1 n=1 Tax=Paragonimus westermani TaxID=34504 RepID=A0A5J4NP92_9TREM|nr:protocadherin delta 1 [Paragonimus westermani]
MTSVKSPPRFLIVLGLKLLLILRCCHGAEEIQVHLQMREETPPFTKIGTVAPSLPGNLGTKLHFMTDSNFFSVTPTVGEVRVARLIDRERLCPDFKLCCGVLACQLDARIFITNKVSGEFAASVSLKVDIQDQNDNRPTFTSPSQKVSISEASPVGTFVNLVPATDADIEPTNQIQRYNLIEPTGTFILPQDELPNVRLQLSRPLDRERIASYTATLEACDPGACARQTVEIHVMDENDNKPVFTTTRFTKRLMENIKVGDVVLQLNAADADSGERGRVIYSTSGSVDPDLLETFELVQTTGEIRLRQPLAANIRDNYRFRVIACDAMTPSCTGDENSTAEITLLVEDINNYAPTIHVVASGVTTLSTDSKTSDRHSVDDGMNISGGEPAYRDRLSILENTAPSQVAVLTVRDADVGENARITCSLNESTSDLSDGHSTNDFILTPSAPGIYSLRTARQFDYELEPTASTKVVCHDYGKPQQLTSARVITVRVIDVNEFQPEFSRRVYVGRVPENAAAGMEILTTTATDRDRGAVLLYRFAAPPVQQGNWDDKRTEQSAHSGESNAEKFGVNKYFVIEPQSGTIRTSQIPLDRETVASVTLVVLVTDSELPPTFTATTTVSIEVLDENDNAPVFVNPPTEPAISASGVKQRPRTKPFVVMENAPRFTRLSEQLEARDPDQGDNGRVHFSLLETYAFTRPVRQDHLQSQHRALLVSDGSIESDLATDFPDELGLTRKVVDQPIFRITPDGGIETLVELDREAVPIYILKIGVQDRGAQPLATTTLLRVEVLDANDNSPSWVFPTPTDRTINLTTAMKPGSLAGRLRAEDSDVGDAGRVDYMFLGPRGEPLKGLSLRDGLLDSLTMQKENTKESGVYTQGSVTRQPHAESGENGYRLGPLYLNGSTGEIWVAQPLTAGAINLHLRAQDRGSPRSQTDAWLTINVFVDPSDDPVFFNFGADGTLNVTIILVMITITAIVSLFLIIGIVCVRRRPVRYTPTRTHTTADGTVSPSHSNLPYGSDVNKESMVTSLTPNSWQPAMGLYTTGQFYATHGSLGSPIMEDGQMFTTLGGQSVMGYGAMVAPSDAASLVYLPQTVQTPGTVGSLGGGSMTPVPMEHGIVPIEFGGRGPMHTFGTLTRTRGSVSGGYYPGSTGVSIAYEPHMDADSGDSGRGPSEEGNQFLFADNYRSVNTSCSVGVPQYNTYSSYRPSSRAGYYRAVSGVDGSSGLVKMHTVNCPSLVNGGICNCFLLHENDGMYPSLQISQPFDGMDHNSVMYTPSYGVPRTNLSMPLPPPPAPPPRSPVIHSSDGNARSVASQEVRHRELHLQSGHPEQNINLTQREYCIDGPSQQDISSGPNDYTCQDESYLNGTVTPLRIDLRKSSSSDANNDDQGEYGNKQRPRIGCVGTGPGLPPLANKKIIATSTSHSSSAEKADYT